jgi:CDGSH-type Zn-finger protein
MRPVWLALRRSVPGEAVTVSDVTIAIDEDGSYIVDGDIRLTDDDGRELDLPHDVQLCRCGHSGNQPFCDGTHAVIDFDGTLAN